MRQDSVRWTEKTDPIEWMEQGLEACWGPAELELTARLKQKCQL